MVRPKPWRASPPRRPELPPPVPGATSTPMSNNNNNNNNNNNHGNGNNKPRYVEEDCYAEEDTYHTLPELYREHLQEVLRKRQQIDGEIWAKVIMFEGNRRVAKAYVRHPLLAINGSRRPFDGSHIGLCSFENPMREQRTTLALERVHNGVELCLERSGAIVIERLCKSNVYVRGLTSSELTHAIGQEITRNSQGTLEYRKPGRLFDRERFRDNLDRVGDGRPLQDLSEFEHRCLNTFSTIVFVRSEPNILECPVWVLFINIEALQGLTRAPVPRSTLLAPGRRLAKENPYNSIARPSHPGSQAQQQQIQQHLHQQRRGNNGPRRPLEPDNRLDRPPKLPPPRRTPGALVPKPDYDSAEEDEYCVKVLGSRGQPPQFRAPPAPGTRAQAPIGTLQRNNDDPYYHGFYARVSKFVKRARNQNPNNNQNGTNTVNSHKTASHPPPSSIGPNNYKPGHPHLRRYPHQLPPGPVHQLRRQHAPYHYIDEEDYFYEDEDPHGDEEEDDALGPAGFEEEPARIHEQIYGQLPIPTRGPGLPVRPIVQAWGDWEPAPRAPARLVSPNRGLMANGRLLH